MWRLWPVGTSGVCGVYKCGACTWDIEQLILKNMFDLSSFNLFKLPNM